MSSRTSSQPSLQLAAGLGAFIAAVTAAAALGVVLALSVLTGPVEGHASGHREGVFGVAEDIRTSFGFVAVEHAETVKGLTSKDLGGAVHGIGSFVGRDRALVKASVTLRNGPAGPLEYSLSQFRLRATTKKGKISHHPVAHATVRDGTLQPDAAVDAGLAFVVPRNGAALALEFKDPERAEPILVDLRATAGKVTAAEKRALSRRHGH